MEDENDENIGMENASEHSLSFTENVADITDMDFKAMRLLVHTSVHEKDLAVSKMNGLEDEITHLQRLAMKYQSPERYKLPLSIVRADITRHCKRQINDKFRGFNVWKSKLVAFQQLVQAKTKEKLILKLARRNILKARLVQVSKAFARWNALNKCAQQYSVFNERRVVALLRLRIQRTTFAIMKLRLSRRRGVQHLVRIGRNCAYRKFLTRWKQFSSNSYRKQLQCLSRGCSLGDVTRSLKIRRDKLRHRFATWVAFTKADQARTSLTKMTNQARTSLFKLTSHRLNDFINKYVNQKLH